MCGLKAAQVHERPFRAAKDHMQPLAALDSFLSNGNKIVIRHHLSSVPIRCVQIDPSQTSRHHAESRSSDAYSQHISKGCNNAKIF